MTLGSQDRTNLTGTLSSAWACSSYYTVQDNGTVSGLGSRTPRPLGCKPDKPPGGIPITPSVASHARAGGGVYLRGEPIRLQARPEGDTQQKEGMSRQYHNLLKLATSSVRWGATNR